MQHIADIADKMLGIPVGAPTYTNYTKIDASFLRQAPK